MEKTAIIITGPTASGKSALSVDLALRLGTEIVSADSRQVFRDIPIATAAPTEQQLATVRHHLVGFLPLEADYSAAKFETDALAALDDIFTRSDVAVVCGGSMMYVDALCNGLDNIPDVPDEIRNAVADDWKRYGDAPMRLRLLGLDPDWYARVDLLNMKRVVHAVEVSLAAGRPYSSLIGGTRCQRPFRILKYSLEPPRDTLYRRIDLRTEAMIADGLEQEARKVYPLRGLNSLNTVGLKEMFAMIDGTLTAAEAEARIKKNTRVYARKQMTWHRRDEATKKMSTAEEILKAVEQDLGE